MRVGMRDQSKISPCEKFLLSSFHVLPITDNPLRDLAKTLYYSVVRRQKELRALFFCPGRQFILTSQFPSNTLNAINEAIRV